MSEIARHVWLNGEIRDARDASPSIASISLNIGTGVFDGMVAYWNGDHYNIFRAHDHLERLRVGAERMSLHFRWTTEELLQATERLLEVVPPRTYYIRPLVLRAAPELFITGGDAQPPDLCIYAVLVGRDNDAPLKCCLSSFERVSSRSMPTHCKVSGIYVNCYLTRKEAEQRGFDDGLMLDRFGRVTEASAANVFFIRGDRLITPEVSPEFLPGITRRVVLEIAARKGIAVEERVVLPQEFADFDGAFLCATLMEIRALAKIENSEYNTARHPLFREVLNEFRALTHA
jgi:branched-chain amino acid aminotransferase